MLGRFRRISTRQRAQLRGIFSRLRADQFDELTARQLRSERVTALMNNLTPFTLFNAVSAVFLAVWFFDHGVDSLLTAWVSVLISLSIIALVTRLRRDRARPYSGSERTTSRIVHQTIFTACCWSISFFFLLPVSVGHDFLILNGLAVGGVILGPTVLHPVPKAALAWLVTTTSLNTVAFVMFGDIHLVAAAIMNIAFTLVAGVNCIKQSDYMTRQFVIRQSLQEKQDMIALLLKEYEDGVRTWPWECDSFGHITRMPKAVENLLGRARGGLCWNISDLARVGGEADQNKAANELIGVLSRPRKFHDYLVPFKREGEESLWFSVSGKPVYSQDGEFLGYRGLITDVTETKLAEEKVKFLATHDSLTEMPNRTLYADTVGPWIERERTFVCLHIDLDRFKLVNDSLGHAAGDDLLVAVAERLRGCAANVGPEAICARVGGDEFLAALPAPKDEDWAADDTPVARAVGEIVDCLSQPFELDAGTVTIGGSVGYALYPDDASNLSDLTNRADLALYRAKNEGRNQYRRYIAGMDRRAQNRKKLEVGLRNAIAHDELRLVYQPIVELQSGVVSSVEVLLRWNSAQHGFISPQIFIPIAEESGLIYEIGEWVLLQACQEAVSWKDTISLSVNVSAKQILRAGFDRTVLAALKKTGFPAERLELELTETVFLEEGHLALETIDSLREHGIRIILDDFGTGYSSLSYLQSFSFDKIKVDRSFVSSLQQAPIAGGSTSDTLIRAMIGLAQMLDVPVTAEGIEEDWQAEELRKLGCNYGQGYLFSRPVSSSDLRELIGSAAKMKGEGGSLPRDVA
ncbi:bifunctional diguanylate cyclase/phosphodiesterase [Notoacmeibacter sp. MSK16QG-6]|uniref:putative bifunctional diguanylate cyclase/phosphodiesterase n=1 Tax=Notoacmeibacter sp. MSK16QG-6 TaxID=2957982 RepID=UPI0020A1F91D|nr:EAL domain-containing protein [Notoacmeibacter sp. MSK16QG-6]MCP1198198.1 EAL domain-containing protein [Notoacmeibacter sp. MSK16QG-6]